MTVQKPEPTADEARRLLRDRYEHSLYDFAWDVLGYKAMHPELHRDVVCEFLTTWKPGKSIKLLLIPREHLKSTLASISLPLWLWSLDPEKHDFPCGPETRIMMSHGKRDMSIDFLREIKFHFRENDTFRWIYPHIAWEKPDKDADLWQQDAINVKRVNPSKTPSLQATGTNASVTGFHFHYAFFDDLVYRENVGTPEMRAKTLQYFKDCQSLILRGGKQIVIGTRWHNDDLYGQLLEDPQYEDIIDCLVLSSGYFEGNPIFPVSPLVSHCGFDMERLNQKRKAMGDYDFFSQYENKPQLDAANSFRAENFHRFRLDYDGNIPNGKPVSFVMAVDPNRSTKIGNDPCAVTVAGVDVDYHIWGVDGFRGHPSKAQLIDIMFEMAVKWNVQAIILETTAGQEYLLQDLKAEMIARDRFFKVIEAKRGPTNRKEDRILALQAPSERGHIHLIEGPYFDEAVNELANFGVAKHDDISDTLADIYNKSREIKPVPVKTSKRKPPKSPFLLAELYKDTENAHRGRVARRAGYGSRGR